jgi:hypothetical protein
LASDLPYLSVELFYVAVTHVERNGWQAFPMRILCKWCKFFSGKLVAPSNPKEARYAKVSLQEFTEDVRAERTSILIGESHDAFLKLLQEELDDNFAFLLEEAFG